MSRARAPAMRAPVLRMMPAVPGGGMFSRLTNALTLPTSSPRSGQMVAPRVVQAARAVTSDGYDDGGGDDGGEDLPQGYTDDSEGGEEDLEGIGDINYEQALAGLEGWQDDLKNFGITAGKSVASQALTTVASKLGGGSKSYTPTAPPPMSTATKVAIGAAIALPVGYLVLRRPAT